MPTGDVPELPVSSADYERQMAEAEKFRAEARKFQLEGDIAAVTLAQTTMDLRDRQYRNDEFFATNRTIHFTADVHEDSVGRVLHSLSEWELRTPGQAVHVDFFLHSAGGSVLHGLALYDFLRNFLTRGHTIDIIGLGMAASMAGVILQAGSRRILGREAWILIHEAQLGTGGTMGQVEDNVAWVKALQERIVYILSERSKLKPSQIRRRWKRKDWWIDSAEALRLGLVDEVR